MRRHAVLRKVLRACEFGTEGGAYRLPRGTYIATLLSMTNVEPARAAAHNCSYRCGHRTTNVHTYTYT